MDNKKQVQSNEVAGRNFVLREANQDDSVSQGMMETYNQVNDMYSQHRIKPVADTLAAKNSLDDNDTLS